MFQSLNYSPGNSHRQINFVILGDFSVLMAGFFRLVTLFFVATYKTGDIYKSNIRLVSNRVNDIVFRLLLIPFCGIGIPLVTGLINADHLDDWKTKIEFLYTIGIAFIIWHANRYILIVLRPYFPRFKKPFKKIATLLLIVLAFTIPISTILIIGWYWIFEKGIVDWKMLTDNVFVIAIAVVFITPLYEILFLVKEALIDRIGREQLEFEKNRAELEAIKNQIDPHFIFNALNNLAYLIETDRDRAKMFNITLARVYLYILQHKDIHLVPLGNEIQFLKDYFYLSEIRFESCIYLQIDIPDDLLETTYIPSISLQLLLENAIKHNQFSESNPLVIRVTGNNEAIIVHNTKLNRRVNEASPKIGLSNLNTRYMLLTGHSLVIRETQEEFFVSLTLIRK
ncbi:MAG: histidine kinase [Chitinophagaceae bacterium]|nr:histidine kinase [Chitinophagaceae bacterium]